MVLWWLIQITGHLHILGELPFEQMDEQDLASAIKTTDRTLGIGVHPDGGCLHLGIPHVAYTVGTPEIIANLKQKKPGFRGETIGDALLHYGIVVTPADEDAVNGWKRCQSLLRTDPDGQPWLTIDPACTHLTNAIRSGLQDAAHTDDVSNPAPALVAFRYGAMTRPTPYQFQQRGEIPPGSPADIMRKLREARSQGRHSWQVRR
jgi:hypothetical protein